AARREAGSDRLIRPEDPSQRYAGGEPARCQPTILAFLQLRSARREPRQRDPGSPSHEAYPDRGTSHSSTGSARLLDGLDQQTNAKRVVQLGAVPGKVLG